jgi:ABC-type histidine transport system ATPase subunit
MGVLFAVCYKRNRVRFLVSGLSLLFVGIYSWGWRLILKNYADIIRQIIRAAKQEIIDWCRHSADRFGLSGTLDVLPHERLALVQLQHLSRIAAYIYDT